MGGVTVKRSESHSTITIRWHLQHPCPWACFRSRLDPPIPNSMVSPMTLPQYLQIPNSWCSEQSLLVLSSAPSWTCDLTRISPSKAHLLSALSCPTCGTRLPSSMLYQKEKNTHKNLLKTLCVHQTFLKLGRDKGVSHYHAAWHLHPCLTFGRGSVLPSGK